MNKKIASELAIGIILIVAIVIGSLVWLGSKTDVEKSQEEIKFALEDINKFDTSKIVNEATNFLNNKEYKLRSIQFFTQENNASVVSFNYSNGINIKIINYIMRENKYFIEEANKFTYDESGDEFNRIIASPNMPELVMQFGLEDAFNKIKIDKDFDNFLPKINGITSLLEYDKQYDWVWKVTLVNKNKRVEQGLQQSLFYIINSNGIEATKKIGL